MGGKTWGEVRGQGVCRLGLDLTVMEGVRPFPFNSLPTRFLSRLVPSDGDLKRPTGNRNAYREVRENIFSLVSLSASLQDAAVAFCAQLHHWWWKG